MLEAISAVELAPVADGRIFVGIRATICEREGDLENREMASERVTSIDGDEGRSDCFECFGEELNDGWR